MNLIKGNIVKNLISTEAERIKSAFQFDPLFAVNCSIVYPIPHQVEAAYKFLMPIEEWKAKANN